MIFDSLENHARYTGLGPGFSAAFEYLIRTDLAALTPGRIDLQGDALYVMVQEYITKPVEQAFWESHRRYIDLQYLSSGSERMGFARLNTMHLGEYVPEKDFQPMSGTGQTLDARAGDFVIFHPEDAHMPGLALAAPAQVRKVVVKIKI